MMTLLDTGLRRSVRAHADTRRRSKEAGFDYHLTKPVDFRLCPAAAADAPM
jgi:hypothetical protein